MRRLYYRCMGRWEPYGAPIGDSEEEEDRRIQEWMKLVKQHAECRAIRDVTSELSRQVGERALCVVWSDGATDIFHIQFKGEWYAETNYSR
jgi:hypothetical protein